MPTPHPSNSQTQKNAERLLLSKMEKKLKCKLLEPFPPELNSIRLDGFGVNADGQPVLVEAYAHIGPLKPGHRKKISRDILKLLLAEKLLNRPCRKIIVLADQDILKTLKNGWEKLVQKEFQVEIYAVALPEQATSKIKEAQKKQKSGISGSTLE